MIERPIIFIDTETTGTSVTKDRIIELSLLKYDPETSVTEIKTKRFNPGISIPESATAVHGIKDEDVKDEKPFSSFAKSIHDFLHGSDIAGFNSNSFDLPILNAEFLRCNIHWDFTQHHLIDIGNIYKIMNPRTLSAALLFYCERSHDDAHGAEADVIATKDVFISMMAAHADQFPASIKELALMSNFDKPIADLSGFFTYDNEGDLIFTFGKHRNEKAKTQKGFLSWMLKNDFPQDTKLIASSLL